MLQFHPSLLLALFAVIGGVSKAHGDSIEASKATKNIRVSAVKLSDKTPEVRLQAARTLRELVKGIESETELKLILSPLVNAMLNDQSAKVRENARFALRDALSKVEDNAALVPVAESLLGGLKHKDVTIRAHCAHDLSNGVVGKIDDAKALQRMLGRLTVATLHAESMEAADF
ncbi:MAG: hypothetical protein KDA84_30435, partial [Planctomycetaceae bacterium]|nr:hypothetical protein [Planctomycetaceae bacterium]